MKKLLSLLLAVSLCSTSLLSVSASTKTILDFSEEEIQAMSDDEYLSYYTEYYIDAKKELSDDEIKDELSEVGIEYTPVYNVTTSRAASKSTDITLSVTLSRRSGQSYTYITGVARTAVATLASPSTEDIMTLEWQPSKGTYYGYSESTNTTLNDYSKRSKGVLVFNVQDSNMKKKNQYATCSAKVTLKKNSDAGDIGVIYIHTYTSSAPTLTLGGNVKYTDGQVSGGASISLTVSYKNSTWKRSYLYSE